MLLKHATAITPPSSSKKRARLQLVAVRRALDYHTPNRCTTMVVYKGADNIQMLYSEHMLITRLWMCHMMQCLYHRLTDTQINDILVNEIHATCNNLHGTDTLGILPAELLKRVIRYAVYDDEAAESFGTKMLSSIRAVAGL